MDKFGSLLQRVSTRDSCRFAAGLAAVLIAHRVVRSIVSRVARVSPQGKVILITGCDSGFGHALALKLNAAGAIVLAGCLTETGAAELRQKASCADRMRAFTLDVTSADSVVAAFGPGGPVEEVCGAPCVPGSSPPSPKPTSTRPLWAVVNNAGVFLGGPLWTNDMNAVDKMFQVNVMGVVRITHAAMPHLLAATTKPPPRLLRCIPFWWGMRPPTSRVITVASVAGRVGAPGTACYSASKYAACGLMEALGRELHACGVGSSVIEPGIMRTPLWNESLKPTFLAETWERLTPAQRAFYGEPYFAKSRAMAVRVMDLLAGHPDTVVRTMESACLEVYPRRRYVGRAGGAGFLRCVGHFPLAVQDVLSHQALFPQEVPAALQ
eukprot:TRINITY_DN12879_c0_g1_i1.p1 TRINITY_DN12879_c0_g1~~TRINITY_DN12879_c0_g1_i1.p1  ORF type:complete len:381 (+),score=38.32 TRINITY_DN12879_c0_g1_i1:87-1229(+)